MRETIRAEKYKMRSESECHLTKQFNPGTAACSCPIFIDTLFFFSDDSSNKIKTKKQVNLQAIFL